MVHIESNVFAVTPAVEWVECWTMDMVIIGQLGPKRISLFLDLNRLLTIILYGWQRSCYKPAIGNWKWPLFTVQLLYSYDS